MKRLTTFLSALCLIVLGGASASAAVYRGRVVDALTKQPRAAAFITVQDTVVQTDATGHFQMSGESNRIGIRAYGHMRAWVDSADFRQEAREIALSPLTPKTLYLSVFGVGN